MLNTAYIGPGAGVGSWAAGLALLALVAVSLFVVVLWPLRLLWRRLRGGRRREEADERTP